MAVMKARELQSCTAAMNVQDNRKQLLARMVSNSWRPLTPGSAALANPRNPKPDSDPKAFPTWTRKKGQIRSGAGTSPCRYAASSSGRLPNANNSPSDSSPIFRPQPQTRCQQRFRGAVWDDLPNATNSELHNPKLYPNSTSTKSSGFRSAQSRQAQDRGPTGARLREQATVSLEVSF